MRYAAMIFVGLTCTGCLSAVNRALYAVAADPRAYTELPAVLHLVDFEQLKLVPVRQIIAAGKGVGAVLDNQEARILLTGSPPFKISRIGVVRMDAPEVDASFGVASDVRAPVWHFLAPSTEVPYLGYEYTAAHAETGRRSLLGVNLLTFSQVALSPEMLNTVLVSGTKG